MINSGLYPGEVEDVCKLLKEIQNDRSFSLTVRYTARRSILCLEELEKELKEIRDTKGE